MKHKFPAKVLLFGEHTILRGSQALALPLWARYSEWQTGGTTIQQAGLTGFADYLEAYFPGAFALGRLREDLLRGQYLASNIPVGYGLGSSGAVCVAVFTTYATPAGKAQLAQESPKAFFARMESYFHGTSSGTDPLIIYLEQAIQLFPDGTYQQQAPAPLPAGWQLFLLDTGHPRKTGPLVNYFTQRYDADTEFQAKVSTHWAGPSDAAISALLKGEATVLWENFRTISEFQLTQLPPMVLPAIKPVWQAGLASDHYLLKICGAGGGGYCLGLSNDWPKTREALAAWELIVI